MAKTVISQTLFNCVIFEAGIIFKVYVESLWLYLPTFLLCRFDFLSVVYVSCPTDPSQPQDTWDTSQDIKEEKETPQNMPVIRDAAANIPAVAECSEATSLQKNVKYVILNQE